MADGDLAYSHVAADAGALLCRPADNALLFRRTRTFWRTTLSVSFRADEYAEEDIPEFSDWIEGTTGSLDGRTASVMSGSWPHWSMTFVDCVLGTEAPYGPGEHSLLRFRAVDEHSRRDASGSIRIPSVSTWGSEPRLYLSYGVSMIASVGGLSLASEVRVDAFERRGFYLTSATVTQTRLPHAPDCPHIH